MGLKNTVFGDVAGDLETDFPGVGATRDSAMVAHARTWLERAGPAPVFLMLFFDGTHFNRRRVGVGAAATASALCLGLAGQEDHAGRGEAKAPSHSLHHLPLFQSCCCMAGSCRRPLGVGFD